MPDITVTGDDCYAAVSQSCSCFEELIPAAGAGADDLADLFRIVCSEDILCNGSSVNESTAGSLIAKADQFAIGRAGTDLDGVVSDISSFCQCSNVDAQIFVSGSEFSSVTLSIFQNESGFRSIDVSFTGCKHLVKSRLV